MQITSPTTIKEASFFEADYSTKRSSWIVEQEEGWGKLLFARSLNVLVDIAATCHDEDDDPDFIKPTEQAYTLANQVVRCAYSEITLKLPTPKVLADEIGGIRLRWVNGDREIRLSCHSNSAHQSYIYHQENEIHGLLYDVTPEKLTYWLRWLINA